MKSEININELNNKVADRICLLRKNKGISQEQLADRIGVSSKTISRWENHECEISFSGMLGVSKLFGISLDYLCYAKEEGEGFLFSCDAQFNEQGYEELQLAKEYIKMTNELSLRERRLFIGLIKAIVELIKALRR